jgi:xylitol oxidase
MNYCHLRVIRADDQWLSPSTTNDGEDSLAIAFGLNRVLWGEDGSALMAEAALLEAALAPFAARPHWGKLSAVTGKTVDEL